VGAATEERIQRQRHVQRDAIAVGDVDVGLADDTERTGRVRHEGNDDFDIVRPEGVEWRGDGEEREEENYMVSHMISVAPRCSRRNIDRHSGLRLNPYMTKVGVAKYAVSA
jgi:hypothetical protein